MRKVFVTVTTKLVLIADEGVNINQLMDEANIVLDHEAIDNESVTVEDSRVETYEITDSK